MSQTEKSKPKRGKKEEQLYEPILDALKVVFEQYVIREAKKVMQEPLDSNVYLEITAKGHFSEMLKEQLDDRALSIIRVEKFSPDIMGFMQKTSSSQKELITVEVKAKRITIKDISRAKLYQDIFKATYGLLISPIRIPEEIRRFIFDRYAIKGNFIIAQFDEAHRILRIHPTFEYQIPEPFKKCTKL